MNHTADFDHPNLHRMAQEVYLLFDDIVFRLSSTTFEALNLEQGKKGIGHQLRSYLEQGSELRNRLRSWAEKECEKSWNNVTYLKNMSEHV